MTDFAPRFRVDVDALASLGEEAIATLYLDRCQVDTPNMLVKAVWDLVNERRKKVGSVVDFGAGDARFARYGKYASYLGYEIDPSRCSLNDLPGHAEIVNACAFSEGVHDADVSIGNPPYVRNQDLPVGWRQKAARTLEQRTGVKVSGLANAWQYFFLLSIASTNRTGLVALVIPYEWVSRPSCKALRDFIKKAGWDVNIYRLQDKTFDRVPTAQMDVFAFLMQMTADHLLSSKSTVEELATFKELRESNKKLKGAAFLWPAMEQATACMRGVHWYK